MSEDQDRPVRSLSLPPLKPRPKPGDPFSGNMAAVIAAGMEEAPALERQAQAAPSKSPPKETTRPAIKADEETARVHTRIPVPLMIEFQVYCARNRTTQQDVVHGLIAELMAKQTPAESD